jgi:hypothetical protein
VGDTWRPPAPSYELPKCEACGKQTTCNLVILANAHRWYLCPEICMPAFLAEAEGWLKREQRHNELLREAGEEDDDETEIAREENAKAFLASLGVKPLLPEP